MMENIKYMPNTAKHQKQQNVFLQQPKPLKQPTTARHVGQDNNAPLGERIASLQPSTVARAARTRQADTKVVRTKKHSTKRQTVMAAGWVKRPISSEIDRLANHEGLTRSATIASLLEEAVHQRLHVQHAILLQPIIKQAIADQMRKDRARFAALLVRIAFDANSTRHLVGNILG